MIFIGTPGLLARVGDERHRARAPDGAGELALMTRAAPRDAPGGDLAALGDEAAQAAGGLVVDEAHLVHTELADLAPAEPATLHRLRCRRNGSLLLEGDLVVPVLHGLAALDGSARRHRSLRPAHELHALGHHLDDAALLSVLRLPVPGLQPPFPTDGAALVQVLPARLGLLAPHHHGEEARLFALLPTLGRV